MVRQNNTPNDLSEYHGQLLVDALEAVGDAYFILDKDFKFIQANKMYEQISGISREDSIGKTVWELFSHTDTTESPYWVNYHTVAKTKKPISFVMPSVRRKAWLEIRVYPTSFDGISVLIRDITDRVLADQAMQESERRLSALVNASTDVIYRMSPDWTEMRQLDGRNFLADTGAVDTNWLEKYIPPEEQSRVRKAINSAIRKKNPFVLEHQVYQADGAIGWTLSRAIPIQNDDGDIIEWFGAASDVTERRRQTETNQRMELLTEQRNALITISKTKDEFIALASHQLRTPATAVKQYIGMLLNEFAGPIPDIQKKFLQTAYDSNERELRIINDLLRIINDLLRTAQIDGTMPDRDMAAETQDIVELVRESIADLQSTTDQNDQTVQLTGDLRPAKVHVDVTEMKLALTNLIENASKYSPSNSEIIVDIARKDRKVQIAVIDHGVGVSRDDQQRVFEKFTRGYNEFSEKVSGTGLGLYWVKQITEMHGGSIDLVSQTGKGSTFTMTLPLTKKYGKKRGY